MIMESCGLMCVLESISWRFYVDDGFGVSNDLSSQQRFHLPAVISPLSNDSLLINTTAHPSFNLASSTW